jgi:hypothetical protein
MEDLNVASSKKLLVISPTEIKIKVNDVFYNLVEFPSMGVDYTYLYYEPETENVKKVISNDNGDLVYESLTNEEITLIEDTLGALNDPQVLTEFLSKHEKKPVYFIPPAPLESAPPAVPVHCVDKDNSYCGQKVLPQEGYKEVLFEPPESLFVYPFGVSYRWNDEIQNWKIVDGYKGERRAQYLKTIPVGDQLGALVSAVQALANNQPVPEEFNKIVLAIQEIKNNNPKA